ncbi:hypothetical protein WJ40_00840 [Burkholderia cepacia]|nr:hypothetical protein WJ40_00840 [Burkholderia cepacia]
MDLLSTVAIADKEYTLPLLRNTVGICIQAPSMHIKSGLGKRCLYLLQHFPFLHAKQARHIFENEM